MKDITDILQHHDQRTRGSVSIEAFKSNIKRQKTTFSVRTMSVANESQPFQTTNITQRCEESFEEKSLQWSWRAVATSTEGNTAQLFNCYRFISAIFDSVTVLYRCTITRCEIMCGFSDFKIIRFQKKIMDLIPTSNFLIFNKIQNTIYPDSKIRFTVLLL